MNADLLNSLKHWFAEYVTPYYTGDPDTDLPISLKEAHTRRVCENILFISEDIGLSEQDRMLAETIALFHDIGRFEQYARYGTFMDAVSEDHAKLGLRQIGLHRILLGCSAAEKRLIAKAIAYHNRRTLPINGDHRSLLFMRLIRDADKLDIWKVLIEYYKNRHQHPNSAIELGFSDQPVCSEIVVKTLEQGKPVNLKDLKTLDDFRLFKISWVYDLNFKSSFRMVYDRNYIPELAEMLPKSPAVGAAVQNAYTYVLTGMSIT